MKRNMVMTAFSVLIFLVFIAGFKTGTREVQAIEKQYSKQMARKEVAIEIQQKEVCEERIYYIIDNMVANGAGVWKTSDGDSVLLEPEIRKQKPLL